jgi:two-component system sensor histidine kinase KdpD
MRARGEWTLWFGVLIVVGAAMLFVRDRLDKAQVALAFLLVVLWGSSAAGRALGVSLAGAAFLVFNWFFLPPYNTLVISNPLDWLVLLAFLVTGVTAAQLLERERQQADVARRRADEIDRLATLGAETLNAPRAVDALDAIAAVIRDAIGTDECGIFLQEVPGLRLAGASPRSAQRESESGLLAYTIARGVTAAERADGTLTVIEQGVGAREFGHAPREGLNNLVALGIPLAVRKRTVGALRLASAVPFSLSDDQQRVLAALAYYAALGAERVRLAEAEEETEALRRADRLKDSLLAAVSHDLRTPLTAIKGIANEVWRGGDPMRAVTIEQEADQMSVLVDDLLQLSQINAGVVRMQISVNTVDDVVGPALERIEASHPGRQVRVQIENDGGILAGAFDLGNTTRALTNLMENAIKYSPPDAPVTLHVRKVETQLLFTVGDRGAGVSLGDEQRIFEPFFRGGQHRADGVRGTGLGLSIARQLVEAQDGTLVYERVADESRFTISLPAAALPAD